jgi:hypothetical protein
VPSASSTRSSCLPSKTAFGVLISILSHILLQPPRHTLVASKVGSQIPNLQAHNSRSHIRRTTTMCHTINMRLACGHTIHGPTIQCSAAASLAPHSSSHSHSHPRSRRHDTTANANAHAAPNNNNEAAAAAPTTTLCDPGITINTATKAYCETCVTGFTRQLLASLCRRCRRGVVHGMMAQAVLASLPAPSPSPSPNSFSSSDEARARAARSSRLSEAHSHW